MAVILIEAGVCLIIAFILAVRSARRRQGE